MEDKELKGSGGPPRSKTIHTGEEEKSVRRWFRQRNKYHFLHLLGSFFLVKQKEKTDRIKYDLYSKKMLL